MPPVSNVVLDASAVLALLQHEPGRDEVIRHLRGAYLSTVNLAEVLAKMADYGVPLDEAGRRLKPLPLHLVPLDAPQAQASAALRPLTRAHGLSLGDRACLALAQTVQGTVLTTERAWADLDLGITIRRIR